MVNPSRLTIKVRALMVARKAGYHGLSYQGVSGGNHVFKDAEGRLVGVDLVVEQTCLYVGIAPRITPY